MGWPSDQETTNTWRTKYLDSTFEAGGDCMSDVKIHIVLVRQLFGKIRHDVWVRGMTTQWRGLESAQWSQLPDAQHYHNQNTTWRSLERYKNIWPSTMDKGVEVAMTSSYNAYGFRAKIESNSIWNVSESKDRRSTHGCTQGEVMVRAWVICVW